MSDSSPPNIDSAQWDADCEAAFLDAFPPQWEFRDRAWGAPALWRAFPSSVTAEINALARRGQRQGFVSLVGCELLVDLHEKVAIPTDQDQYAVHRMLRKTTRQPQVNKKALKQLYLKYSKSLSLHSSSDDARSDSIYGDKFLELFKDLDVDPVADVTALALAAACNAQEMGVFQRLEFVTGCARLEVDNIDDFRAKILELREGLLNGTKVAEVYTYTFGFALDPRSKVLPLDEARQYWALLLPDWELREPFCDWANEHMKGRKTVNRDLWMMVYKFATEVPPDLSTYDDNPAWPVLLDEFVEYRRAEHS